MEILDENTYSENSFISNSEIRSHLTETAKWAKFLAIVGFIGIGLLAIFALFIGSIMSSLTALSGGMSGMQQGFPTTILTFVYLIMAAIYFFPVYYLYNFAVKMKDALYANNEESLVLSFQNLKSMYKFMGIFTTVILSLYGFMFLIGMLAGVSTLL